MIANHGRHPWLTLELIYQVKRDMHDGQPDQAGQDESDTTTPTIQGGSASKHRDHIDHTIAYNLLVHKHLATRFSFLG